MEHHEFKVEDIYYIRAIGKHHRNEYQGAIDDYTKAIRQKPEFAVAYLQRGLTYLKINQKTKAKQDFLRAKELGDSIPHYILNMCC